MRPDPWPPIVFRPLLAGAPELMGHHRALLDDEVRTSAFIRALDAQVAPGDVVCDLGAGTGVLSLAARRAGARRVYAIEHASIARLARRVIATHGEASSIEVIERHARDVALPEPVDVLVSECLGILGLGSTMIRWLCALRDRSLAPGGRVIPRSIGVGIAAVEGPELRAYVEPFAEPRYGFDFSALHEVSRHNLYNAAIDRGALLTDGARAIEVDLLGAPHEDERAGRVVAAARRDGALHGLVGWFEADLGAGLALSTAPGAPRTVWRQVFLPLDERSVRAGDPIEMTLRFAPHPTRVVDVEWSARVGEEPAQRRATRLTDPREEP